MILSRCNLGNGLRAGDVGPLRDKGPSRSRLDWAVCCLPSIKIIIRLQARLLQEPAAHDDPRDHILYSMALGTGLRLRELLGLNVGDVSPGGRDVRRTT